MWPFTLFEVANDVPKEYFKKKKIIQCVVVKIVDGDTFRLRHTTFWHKNSIFDGSIAQHTLNVRIAAVDAPETSKSGPNNGQKFSEEAKIFATKHLLGKSVKLKLLSIDQYGRIIGLIFYKKDGLHVFTSSERNMSEELLRKGLAVVYRQGGAQYDGGIERWNLLEAEAIRKKVGMWVNGSEKVELPSEFKKKKNKV
jgi:endonuclease YncB( thermonuclease family)